MDGFWYVITAGLLVLVVTSFVGVAAAWMLARLMDRANYFAQYRLKGAARWWSVVQVIESDPRSAAIYYGARWIGICILIGMLFSRAV